MAHYTIIAGTTAALKFQLLDAGAPINLTTITVALLLTNHLGVTVASPGVVSITDATAGKIQLAPTDINVFVPANGPYTARWKLTDGSGKISYLPSGPRDVWEIIEA